MSFTPKTREQLAWDAVKAAVNARLNFEVAVFRAERRNEMLAELWPAFEAALHGDTYLEIDPEFSTWIADAQRMIGETSTVAGR